LGGIKDWAERSNEHAAAMEFYCQWDALGAKFQMLMTTPGRGWTMCVRACLIWTAGVLGWSALLAMPAMRPLDMTGNASTGGNPPWAIGPEPVVPPIIVGPIYPIDPIGPIVGPWWGNNTPYFTTSVFTWTDGNQYGVTVFGGNNDTSAGTVFEETPDGNETTLYSFDGDGNGNYPNGSNPFALVPGNNGEFYGATSNGGLNNYGTIFELSPDGSNFTSLVSFDNTTMGATPNDFTLASDGNFYGTTLTGGTGGDGTLFQMMPDGTLTTLFSFAGDELGGNPSGVGQVGDGNLYGTTTAGGANGAGTVFTLAPGGALATLADFPAQAGFADGTGSLPYSATSTLTGLDGNTYGVTMFGGNFDDSAGSVFVETPDGTVTTLYSFDSDGDWNYPNGSNPYVLLQTPDGNLYGATSGGGADGYGTIFEVAPDGSAFTTLVNFDSTDNGSYPNTLILASDGNFYGTTSNGGPSDSGTVFEMTPDGTLTTLFTFSGDGNGAYPVSLVQGDDGNFYGTTTGGGANGSGTLFQLMPDGTLNTLVSFDTGGSYGVLPLINILGAVNGPGPVAVGGGGGGFGGGGFGGGGGGGNTTGTPTGKGSGFRSGKGVVHVPVVTLNVIGPSKRLAFRPNLMLHGLATGAGGVKSVEFSVNGGTFQTATGTKHWVANVSLAKGKNTIVVRVTNSKGQQTTQTITVNRRK
jgi:uncharacterized repeat protein (TIGR03803 family)